MSLIWQRTMGEGDVDGAARDILATIRTTEPFCVWLIGPLGAGKTTVTKAILRVLGLNSRVQVTSPTYTYVNEYEIGGRWYAHLDLYRLPAGLALEDLGLVDSRTFVGFFVEWPTSAPRSPVIIPTHLVEIDFDGDRRSVRFSQSSSF